MKYKSRIGVLLFLIIFIYSCKNNKINTNNPTDDYTHKFTILYTNDEHGWIEKSEFTNGAASLMGQWQAEEEYDGDESFLILSGGDNWTGPAISTWFEGESTVEIMNAMEYDASAIGNHEFDFKVDILEQRISEANFPYLSANIRDKVSGAIPDFATPYIIKEIDGVFIGIIGLSSLTTPWTTFPEHVQDYDFIDYSTALNEIVPIMRTEGAELLIAVTHLCPGEMTGLTHTLIDLGVSVIGGGHCHNGTVATMINTSVGQVASIKSESAMTNYVKLEIFYDADSKEVISIEPSVKDNEDGNSDQVVDDIIANWRTKTNAELSEVIGYASEEIAHGSNELGNMVVDSWLFNYPNADIAMTNSGGIRQSIPAGDITKEIIIGVLPFQNNIIELQLTGAEIIELLENQNMNDIIIGGMTTIGGYKLIDDTLIDNNTNYSVLFTDFLYTQSDYPLSQYDPNPYYTEMNYHQPTIDWIKSFNTSASDPLNNYLDGTARR